jgi:serine/threonine protein phosphatase PrpC
MPDIVLLASDHVAALPVARALGRAACALGKGEGPSTNPKISPNEDSVFIVERGGQLLVGVADSHFGHQGGERLVRGLLDQVEHAWPSDATSLREAVLRADERDAESVRDRSSSTLLAALVAGNAAHWVSVADSVLYLVTARGIRALNRATNVFGGGRVTLRTRQQRQEGAGIEIAEHGTIHCDEGNMLLLCSDGILEESSGVSPREVGAAMRSAGSLVDRTAALALRACSREQGGGRDNVGIVAVAFP